MSELKTLKQDWEKKKWEEIAEDVVRYQDFKASVAWPKIRSDRSKTTRINYLNAGRNYILTGKPRSIENVGAGLFKAIDEVLKKHIQPLTPKESERVSIRGPRKANYAKKDANVPVANLDILKKPITAKFEYGVKYGKTIYLQDSDLHAQIFLDGIKATGNNGSIVSVELGEI